MPYVDDPDRPVTVRATCGNCAFWERLKGERGVCGLRERGQKEGDWCERWEAMKAEVEREDEE